jgi:dTDP-4-amino-4,6-dideoxygalactose transaminase
MMIPLLDLKAQYKSIKKPLKKAIDSVLDSQHFIMGEPVQTFENEINEYIGSKHAISCASGSDALLLALMALDCGPNDLVLTTPYSFFATGGAVARLGATPVFLDIDPSDYNLDPNQVEDFMKKKHPLAKRLWTRGKKVRSMIPVHLYGQCAQMPALLELANKHGLVVIEDAAQSIGATVDGSQAGTMGTFGCFSFFPSKNLGCYGDGGLITVNDDDLAEKVRILRLHGSKPKYHHSLVGINSRLDTIQAAILSVKLKYLDDWTEKRRKVAHRYNKMFSKAEIAVSWDDLACSQGCEHMNSKECALQQNPDLVVIPSETTGSASRNGKHIYHQYVIRSARRDHIMTALNDAGIGNAVYYPISLHEQACFATLGYERDDCKAATCASQQTLALPIYPELDKKSQQLVVDTIVKAVRTV